MHDTCNTLALETSLGFWRKWGQDILILFVHVSNAVASFLWRNLIKYSTPENSLHWSKIQSRIFMIMLSLIHLTAEIPIYLTVKVMVVCLRFIHTPPISFFPFKGLILQFLLSLAKKGAKEIKEEKEKRLKIFPFAGFEIFKGIKWILKYINWLCLRHLSMRTLENSIYRTWFL